MSTDQPAGRHEPSFTPAEQAPAPLPVEQAPVPPQPETAPNPYASTGPDPYGSGQVLTPVTELPPERVLPGLALALLAIPVGAGLAAIIWHLGFVASISTFLLAALAVFLYRKGSGGQVRRGIPGIAAIILVGAVVSFFAAVATDISSVYNDHPEFQDSTRAEFIRANLFYGPVLSGYAKDAGLFVLFAVLGGFSVIMRLVRANRATR